MGQDLSVPPWGRFCALRVVHSKSILCGGFLWACSCFKGICLTVFWTRAVTNVIDKIQGDVGKRAGAA